MGGGPRPVYDPDNPFAQQGATYDPDNPFAPKPQNTPPTTAASPTSQYPPWLAKLLEGSKATNLAKNIPLALGGEAGAAIGGLAKGAGLLKRIGASTLAGGTVGLLSGAARSDAPTTLDRLTSPEATGAGLGGAAFGFAVPAIGATGRAVGEYFGLAPKTTQTKAVSKWLTQLAERQGKTPAQLAAEIKANGMPGSIMDMSPEARTLSVNVAKMSPKAERAIQSVVDARVREPVRGALEDVSRAVGEKPANLQTSVARMTEAIEKNDNKRFSPIWQKFTGPINDPALLQQWDAIVQEIPASVNSLSKEQTIALRPLNQVLQKIKVMGSTTMVQDGRYAVPIIGSAETRAVPTLRGVHRVKVMLDKAVQAADKAEAAGNLTSDQSMAIGAVKQAVGNLRGLSFANVPGGTEYQAALSASHGERQVVGALKEGAKAFANKRTSQDVAATLQELAGEAVNPNAVIKAFRRGALGDLAARASRTADENVTPLAFLERNDVQAKIAALSSPEKAQQFVTKLGQRQAIAETNVAQSKPSVGVQPLAQMPGQGLAEGYGASGLLGGKAGAAQLLIGSALKKVALGRRAGGYKAAADEIANLLIQKPSPQSAEAFLEALQQYGLLQQGRGVTSARSAGRAGGVIGGLLGRP